jgi:hypothetical protein
MYIDQDILSLPSPLIKKLLPRNKEKDLKVISIINGIKYPKEFTFNKNTSFIFKNNDFNIKLDKIKYFVTMEQDNKEFLKNININKRLSNEFNRKL